MRFERTLAKGVKLLHQSPGEITRDSDAGKKILNHHLPPMREAQSCNPTVPLILIQTFPEVEAELPMQVHCQTGVWQRAGSLLRQSQGRTTETPQSGRLTRAKESGLERLGTNSNWLYIKYFLCGFTRRTEKALMNATG